MTISPLNQIKKDLGAKIRALRQAKRLTGAQLAQACGVPHPDLMNIEKGSHELQVHELLKIAAALEITVAELLEGIC